MEAKNSILNTLLQQAMFNQQQQAALANGIMNPVNLSMSSNDERSEVTSSSSSADEDSPADLSHHRHQLAESSVESVGAGVPHLPHPDLMQAMAAAFTLQRELMQQQQQQSASTTSSSAPNSPVDPSHLVAKALASATMRRPRSEKKPIPDDLKDNKYYERRRRNNLAVSALVYINF